MDKRRDVEPGTKISKPMSAKDTFDTHNDILQIGENKFKELFSVCFYMK